MECQYIIREKGEKIYNNARVKKKKKYIMM